MPDMRDMIDDEAEKDAEALAAQRDDQSPPPAPEPEPEQAPEAEAPAEPVAEAPAEPEPPQQHEPQTVPLAALKEERLKRKELDRQFRELQQQFAEMRGRVDGLGQPKAPEAPKAPEDPEPSYEENPAEWLRWKGRQNERQLAEIRDQVQTFQTERQQRQQQEQQQSQYQQVLNQYANAAREFAAETPDFGPAYQHLIRARVDELQALGWQPQQAVQQAQQEELTIAMQALSQGANPAERLYAVAKMRGYQGQPSAQPQQQAAAPAPAPVPSSQPRVNQQQRAAAAKSLSTAPGAPAKTLSLEDLANMADEDYARQVQSTEDFRRLMGG